MRFARSITSTLMLLLCAAAAQAQERVTITGRVIDEATQQPVPGASVKLKGGMMVFTEPDGRFFMPRVGLGEQTFEVRQLGYDELDATLIVTAGTPIELKLRTNPILLQRIEVMVDRLEARRRGIATTVSAYDLDDLARSPSMTMVDFLQRSTSAQLMPCNRGRDLCIYKRGGLHQPDVWIDERRAYGGMRELEGYPPQLIHSVEIIGGTHIRVYTQRFAKLLAEGKVPLMPVIASSMVR